MVTPKIKIYNIERNMDILVEDNENFDYDFLISLNWIINFRLMQNEKIEIIQCYYIKRKEGRRLKKEGIKNEQNQKTIL